VIAAHPNEIVCGDGQDDAWTSDGHHNNGLSTTWHAAKKSKRPTSSIVETGSGVRPILRWFGSTLLMDDPERHDN
jgi:hypothetical protein